jgi:hypothetical protein
MTSPLLVDRPGGNLLGHVLTASLVLEALLDVVVLALALLAPGLLRHLSSLVGFPGRVPDPDPPQTGNGGQGDGYTLRIDDETRRPTWQA